MGEMPSRWPDTSCIARRPRRLAGDLEAPAAVRARRDVTWQSPPPRRGEKKKRMRDSLLIRFPRVRQDSRRIFDSASGRNAAAPLHPPSGHGTPLARPAAVPWPAAVPGWLQSAAPLGLKQWTPASKCGWTRLTDFLPRQELSIASPELPGTPPQPSPNARRVGSCVIPFEACSAFTRVAACRLAESPRDPFHQRLRRLRCLRRRSDCYGLER